MKNYRVLHICHKYCKGELTVHRRGGFHIRPTHVGIAAWAHMECAPTVLRDTVLNYLNWGLRLRYYIMAGTAFALCLALRLKGYDPLGLDRYVQLIFDFLGDDQGVFPR